MLTDRQKENAAFLIWGVLAIAVVVLWSLSSRPGDGFDGAGWLCAATGMYAIGYATGIHR